MESIATVLARIIYSWPPSEWTVQAMREIPLKERLALMSPNVVPPDWDPEEVLSDIRLTPGGWVCFKHELFNLSRDYANLTSGPFASPEGWKTGRIHEEDVFRARNPWDDQNPGFDGFPSW